MATKIIGRHTIKFGGEAHAPLLPARTALGCGVPSYNFFNLWDFLNDAPNNEGGRLRSQYRATDTHSPGSARKHLGFFVQDDFKIRPNLTLNLGLRWSYFGPLYSKQDNMFRAIPGAGSELSDGPGHSKGRFLERAEE